MHAHRMQLKLFKAITDHREGCAHAVSAGQMRFLFNSLIALMLVMILVGVLHNRFKKEQSLRDVQSVRLALKTLHETSRLHAALSDASVTDVGFSTTLSPEWFSPQVPTNVFLPASHSWVDVAPQDDMNSHPPDPIVTAPDQAGFWYNPSLGIFRARVLPQFTDAQTLTLYNRLNNTALKRLANDRISMREPIRQTFVTPDLRHDPDTPGPAQAVNANVHQAILAPTAQPIIVHTNPSTHSTPPHASRDRTRRSALNELAKKRGDITDDN